MHWFGLTDGWYWIEVGELRLLQYADGSGIDYYVVRLWEDLLQLLPALLEDVPEDLVGFVSGDSLGWNDVESEAADAAMNWYSDHWLYLGYLRDSPAICFSRRDGQVTIDWEMPEPNKFAVPRTGTVAVDAGQFVAAIEEFDRELLAAMAARIAEVEASPLVGVEIDLEQLRREHEDRSGWLQRARSWQRATDWNAIRAGAALLSKY